MSQSLRELGIDLYEEGQFERAKRELARRVEEELGAIRKDGRRKVSAAKLIAQAEEEAAGGTVAEAREERLARSRALATGDRARLRGTKADGVVASID